MFEGLHGMKIIMFCIMTLTDGSTMIHMKEQKYDTVAACEKQAYIDAKNMSAPIEHFQKVNFACTTKENLHNYL